MGGKFEIPIDIANVTVKSVEINRKGAYVITVSSTEQGTDCHICGRKLTKSCGHGRAVILRHLPILGRKTYLRIFPVRYECPQCKVKKGMPVTSTQRLSWYGPATGHTMTYEEHVLFALVNSTVEDVSIKEDVGYEAVMGMIDRRIACEVDWKALDTLEVLGLYEIALKKGHNDFVSIVTAHVDGQVNVLAVLQRLFKHSPDLALAYQLCNELTEIFEQDIIKSRAKRKIQSWITRVKKIGLRCFNTFLSTLDERIEDITKYFHNRHTSGFIEGLNNKIKVLKRRCYGICNIKHLFQRIYLDLVGYRLFA